VSTHTPILFFSFIKAVAAILPPTSRAQTGTACTNVDNTALTGQCQAANGTTLHFDLSCIQPAEGNPPYFSQELGGGASDYLYYLSLWGLPSEPFGQCKLPKDQAAGNTAVQAAKDKSACYALGALTSGSWTYNDATIGPVMSPPSPLPPLVFG